MKPFNIFLLGALLFAANNLQAQDNYSISAFTVTIDGTSNLHSWNERVEKVSGKGIVNWSANKSFALQSFNIVMQVNSIKSDEGSTMNNKTYKALKSDQFPAITFLLTDPLALLAPGVSSHSVAAKGKLTIAGVTKPVTIPIKISEDANKKITIVGSQEVKMTDYGVDPPTALFGVLKTGDAITISFNTTFSSIN
jgi:polyisoprenoid-binding protein YceI